MGSLDMVFAIDGMGYAGAWYADTTQFTASNLRHRGGELHGELLIESASTPVGNGRLHRAAFNFSSSVARERLGKQLERRSRIDYIPWTDRLEEFCEAVIVADQEGEPFVEIGSLPDEDLVESYAIYPFLPKDQSTIIFAAGGTGKSYLAVLCAVAVATGTDVLGFSTRVQGRVLYLDWETDRHEVGRRVRRVAAGLGLAVPSNIVYKQCSGSLASMIEIIARTVDEKGIKLVVVDSIGMASGVAHEGQSAEESAIRLFTALRNLRATILAIDHVTGDTLGRTAAIAKPYGSIYKVNLARSVWELKGSLAEEGQESHLGMFHRKVNSGPLLPAVGLAVVHEPGQVTFKREEVQDEELVQALTHAQRVKLALRGGSMSADEIAEQTGIKPSTVRTVLIRGRGTTFGKRGDGSWGLLAHAND